ncbi:hypothetical protein [Lacrimispora sp.]|uniref:hypothetical protein n=1 Tax=Lacrimispora sp. TaxID=2719234 RepID=UPI0028B24816|nr:hypothetical protein [Lacrimispora sp.]
MTDKKYCIQFAECDGNSKEVYSFDEIEIGTWVDGKPIYRKVITGTLANNSGFSLVFADVSDLKIDRLIDLYGSVTDKGNTNQLALQTSYNRTDGLSIAVNMNYHILSGNLKYHFVSLDGVYSGATAYVVLEYTKK